MNQRKKIKGTTVLALLIFLVLAVMPFCMSMFRVGLFGKYMCFAIIAIGLDMIWGYTGILSLGCLFWLGSILYGHVFKDGGQRRSA